MSIFALTQSTRWVFTLVSGLILALGLLVAACTTGQGNAAAQDKAKKPTVAAPAAPGRIYKKMSEAEMHQKLTPLACNVTQDGATEPPFQNAYWNNHAAGIYVDVTTGEPLFSSLDKYDSGTGWPSFTKPIESGHLVKKADHFGGWERTEIRSKVGDAHLGHVFDDGPGPTGERYCMNSAAMKFIPVDQLEAAGYPEFLPLFGKKPKAAATETAILAGGCFWGMEEILRKIPGVVSTEVGYTGGSTSEASYEDVHSGRTGHAEAVKVVFNPAKLSYADLLEHWFFRMHDPTTLNRQGNDVGTSYRSAIFATTPEQKRIAEEVKVRVGKSGKWKSPIVTQIVTAGPFIRAEEYHQKYLEKNPDGYTCHYLRPE